MNEGESEVNNSFIHCCLAGSAYRECMDNGTWALKSNYSSCEPILEEKVGVQPFLSVSLFFASFILCSSRATAPTNLRRKTLHSDDMLLMGQQLRN